MKKRAHNNGFAAKVTFTAASLRRVNVLPGFAFPRTRITWQSRVPSAAAARKSSAVMT